MIKIEHKAIEHFLRHELSINLLIIQNSEIKILTKEDDTTITINGITGILFDKTILKSLTDIYFCNKWITFWTITFGENVKIRIYH